MARVLIIDDSPTILLVLERILRADGHEVQTLDCFVDLPYALKSAPPDLIILDLEMPALSGVDFGRFIRKYQSFPIPILIHSSHPENAMNAAADELGATGVLGKGAAPEQIQRSVREALAFAAPPSRSRLPANHGR